MLENPFAKKYQSLQDRYGILFNEHNLLNLIIEESALRLFVFAIIALIGLSGAFDFYFSSELTGIIYVIIWLTSSYVIYGSLIYLIRKKSELARKSILKELEAERFEMAKTLRDYYKSESAVPFLFTPLTQKFIRSDFYQHALNLVSDDPDVIYEGIYIAFTNKHMGIESRLRHFRDSFQWHYNRRQEQLKNENAINQSKAVLESL